MLELNLRKGYVISDGQAPIFFVRFPILEVTNTQNLKEVI